MPECSGTSVMPDYDRQVFLNVPFDARYLKLLRALVFSVHACGLTARCALEKDDGRTLGSSLVLATTAHPIRVAKPA